MIKRIFSFAMIFIMGVLAAAAQMPQPNPLPIIPGTRQGVLPNGLSYYILKNSEPKDRANFYIAQKVGSTLETSEQLGLAHFLEHMAFNGTSHFPGKDMLNYLQKKGIRFGADINAYTDYDETVYNIDNVPTSDEALMDSVLLVLHDWSGSILLEEAEIDAERGVINEEWRQRNDAGIRMMRSILPKVYQEPQYQGLPIGTMDVVLNFKPEVLRAYYKKWYRPDQQGIVIVGDFDVDKMEAKVKKLFSEIPMPENAAERTYPNVSDNEKPIFATYVDPEFSHPLARVFFKYDKIPFEYRNTDMAYVNDQVIFPLISTMLNSRLEEYSQDPKCQYAYAGVSFGNFLISKTKGAFTITIVAKDNMQAAYDDALAEVARALKAGFTDSELVRARDQILSGYERRVNEKDKTKTSALGKTLVRHFVDNVATPGIETEYEMQKQVLNAFPVAQINAVCQQILTPTNQVIVISVPEDNMLLTEEAAVTSLNNAINAQYEAYVDEVVTEPLIAKLPKKGKIKSTKVNPALGTTEFELSNGAKVTVKTTDFANDQILMTAWAPGGKRSFSKDQAADVKLMGDAFEMSKMGPFDTKMLPKYLAGKQISLNYQVAGYTNLLNGSSSKKDLKDFMEILYTTFTALGPDKQAYDNMISQARVGMANQEKNPEFVFGQRISETQYANNPMMAPATLKDIDAADYDRMLSMIKATLSNAADFNFIFIGNVDAETLKPLLEQYVASLPSKKKPTEVKTLENLAVVPGIVTSNTSFNGLTPSVMVFNDFSGTNLEYNTANSILVDILGDVLNMNYIETLREQEGGTYGAGVSAYINPNTGKWHLMYNFQTNAEMQQRLRDRAVKELKDLLANGAPEDYFNKVREAALKQLDLKERNNSYWKNQIMSLQRGFDSFTGEREFLQNLTLADFNKFLKNINIDENHIEVVLNVETAN